MKSSLVALLVGIIFAIGLGVSGMTQPQKTLGFLDIFGSWDPSLLFVMMGAITVHFIAYKFIKKLSTPLLEVKWHVPAYKEITPALVVGSLLFGIGWGLNGLCPGPSIILLATFEIRPLIFVISMFAGMYLFRLVNKKLKLRI